MSDLTTKGIAHMRTIAAIICAGILLGMTSGCVIFIPQQLQPTHRYETGPIESSVDFQGCRQFAAELKNGTISIEGWDKPTAAMTARVWSKAYSEESAKRLAESTKVELKRAGDRVDLIYSPAIHLLQNEQIEVSITVHLPFEAAAKAKTGSGDVSAAQLAGPIELITCRGNIDLKATQGPVKCRTSSGDIILEDSMGQVNCQTSRGNIKLTNIRGPMECKTSSGDINVTDATDALNCSTSRGNIKVSIHSEGWKGKKIKLHTSRGDVKLVMLTQ